MASSPFRVAARVYDKISDAYRVRILYDPQERQDRLHSAKAPNILYGGSAGGGKSHGLRWHGILFCLKHANARVLLLRRKFKDLQYTHLLSLQTELPPGIARLNKSEHQLRFSKNGSVMVFGHCRTEADFQDYLSSEWDMILVDESAEFTPWMLQVLPSRLRTTKPGIVPQYVLATNPGGPGHLFAKSRFIDKEVWADDDPTYDPSEYEFIPSSVEDNKYIDDRYKDRLRSLPELERRAFLYGDWDVFAGQVFTEWNPEVHVIQQGVPRGWRWYGGLDWGMRKPGAFYLFAIGPNDNVYCRYEFYFKGRISTEVGNIIGSMMVGLPVEFIACDAAMEAQTGTSAPTILEEVQAGIDEVYGEDVIAPRLVPVAKGPGSRLVRQQVLHRYLAWTRTPSGEVGEGPQLTFHPSCKHAIRTIPALPHSKDRPEEVDTDAEDHAYDAITYFLMSRPQSSEMPDRPIDYDHSHPGFTSSGKRKERPYLAALKRAHEALDDDGPGRWSRGRETEEADII